VWNMRIYRKKLLQQRSIFGYIRPKSYSGLKYSSGNRSSSRSASESPDLQGTHS